MKRTLALALLLVALFLPGCQAVAEQVIHPADEAVACQHRARTVIRSREVMVLRPADAEPPQAMPAPVPASQPTKSPSGCGCSEGCSCGPFCKCKEEEAEKCSEDCTCKRILGTPVRTEASTQASPQPVPNYGILHEAPRPQRERYLLSGEAVSPAHAYQALARTGAPSIPDDRAFLSLTLSGGTDQERAAALKAIAAIGLADVTLVQSYAADNPLLQPGFIIPGTYLQTPSGQVLARSPLMTADVYAALRKKVADYQSQKDPDPLAPAPAPAQPATPAGPAPVPAQPSELDGMLAAVRRDLQGVPGWLWVLLGGAGLVLASKKQPPTQPA